MAAEGEFDLGERQQLVVVGEMEGGMEVVVRPPVGSAEMPREAREQPTRTRDLVPEVGVEPTRDYSRILSRKTHVFVTLFFRTLT
jgi:hypothetical protein